MTVLQRELKKIRGKEVMAIVVTAPGTVDDADTTELYALEKHFKIIFEGDSDYFYYGEGDYVPEEAVEDEEMPSELFELVERTGTIYDADDVALAAGFVAIDDDNSPAPENVVHPNELINNLFEDEWGHSGICYRRLTGASNCNPRLSSFPTQLKPTVFQLFELFFPSEFLKDNVLFIINLKIEGKSVTYGELLRWIGIWFLMATTQGTKRHDFWSVAPTNIFDNASFRLNHLMSRDRFDSILKAIGYTIRPAPDYPDRFHEVREMIEAWNENMQNNFKPGHIVCLDKSMSTWTNMHTCPGFMFVPRKPWPFGNEYHTVCCGNTGIMFAMEIVEGKDAPRSRQYQEFDDLGGKTVGLLLRLSKLILGVSKDN